MSNSYFQFKQFRVEQGDTAMKVSTDACIQGAWTPIGESIKHVLDVGAGTGLLSLMLAQRNPQIQIDAVELDEKAAQQAADNFSASPFNDRLKITQGDIRNIELAIRYDLIVCNPPFFQNSLLGDKAERNLARHTLSLSYQDLFESISKYLVPGGKASIMLPIAEHKLWEALLQSNGWNISQQLTIIPKTGAAPSRMVSLCTLSLSATQHESLTIYEQGHNYTLEFKTLLSPFYLHL